MKEIPEEELIRERVGGMGSILKTIVNVELLGYADLVGRRLVRLYG